MKLYHDPRTGKCNISGEKIRMLRDGMELSQEQLAAKLQLAGLEYTQRTISRIETGERVVPDFELAYLARALKTTISDLLGEVPDCR